VAAGGANPTCSGSATSTKRPPTAPSARPTSTKSPAKSWPIGASTNVALVFSADGGTDLGHDEFRQDRRDQNNDRWSVALGPYADGTTVKYCVSGTLPNGTTVWDNNGGQDYTAIVGEGGGLRMVPATPTWPAKCSIWTFRAGAATTAGAGGFGDFGRIYVNYDETNLYVGGHGRGAADGTSTTMPTSCS
jgi:hypothetical protein